MEPWQSWVIVLGLGGGAYYYYSRNAGKGRHRSRPLQRVNDTTTRTNRRQEDDKFRHDIEGEVTPKGAGNATKANRQRKGNKKQPKESADKAEAYQSTTSGSADADDDLSPAVSPTLGATVTKAPSRADVSDMLESRGAAPSVLRLTEPSQPVRQKQQQAPRPDTPQETKKQRQNKKKAEERKLQREQEEKERQVLLEKQRRTAREARGEPAKNGLQPAKAPTSSAWNLPHHASNVAVSSAPTAPASDGTLLDTFDQDGISTTSSSENATNGTSATTDSMNNSMNWANMPSEEEQMRMAMEDSGWSTVPKGRKVKKAQANSAAGDATGTDGSDSGHPQREVPAKKAVDPTPTTVIPPSVGYSTSNEAAAFLTGHHPMDSDWPVV
ncbi:hypothetical protein AOQ84DRAFT_380791 [Glonium stellatum]|uniref:Uncharacterized protein n=1 Tax=Glonium stellatum TaxID=574774 RepID=A0A8E2JPF9_9PEZI|nr:hypothetical protein AOQ84DRAFT_380791 [Glonium stellatum]